MAHRSGGGSHRSHSSHSHSSHRSHSSSSHRSSGHSSTRSYGSSYNNHSHSQYHRHRRRYIYYNNRGQQRAVYSESQPKNAGIGCLVVFLIVFLFFFIPMAVGYFGSLKVKYGAPEKLNTYCRNPQSHIADKAGVITNDSELEASLKTFEDKTGICPYVITINNEDWIGSFEDYSFDLYYSTFKNNEDHFLIVYSEPESAGRDEFNDWYWETVQGDNTDSIITEKKFKSFRTELQAYLEDDSSTCGPAIRKAIDHSGDYFMEAESVTSIAPVITAGIILIVIPLIILLIFIKWFASNRKRIYTEDTTYSDGSSSGGYINDSSMNRTTAAMGAAASFGQNGYGQNGYGQSGYGNMNSAAQNSMSRQQPYGNGSYGQTGFNQQSYGSGSYGQTGMNQQPYGNGSYGQTGFNQQSYGNGSYGQTGMNQQSSYGNSGYGQNYGTQNAYQQNSGNNQQSGQYKTYGEMESLTSPSTFSSLSQPQEQSSQNPTPVQSAPAQSQTQPADNSGEDDMMAKILAGYGNNKNK